MKTEREMTERNITTRTEFNNYANSFNVYVTDGDYTIVLEDCNLVDRELEKDEFDEILEQLRNVEETEDGWKFCDNEEEDEDAKEMSCEEDFNE
jgi:hypothetical protein